MLLNIAQKNIHWKIFSKFTHSSVSLSKRWVKHCPCNYRFSSGCWKKDTSETQVSFQALLCPPHNPKALLDALSYPLRWSSVQSSVCSSQFSGSARPPLSLCSEPGPPACLSSSHSCSSPLLGPASPWQTCLVPTAYHQQSPLPPWSKSLLLPAPCLVSQLFSLFCSHCLVSWLTLVVLDPKSPLLSPCSQQLCWISCFSPNCLSLSGHLLASVFQLTFSHPLTPPTGGRGIKSQGA